MSNFSTILVSSVILKNESGKILLLRRSDKNKNYKNTWQFPEGKLEYGESFEKTISREVKEETGLILTKKVLKGVFTSITTVSRKKYFIARVVYESNYKGKLKLSKDHDRFEWFSKKEAKLLKMKIIGFDMILKFV